MNDMRSVIVPKSDQINADDLLAGPLTITVSEVTIRPGTEQPVSVHFEGDGGKPYKPCKIMCRVMVQLWGDDANAYVGKRMILYCDPKVTWGGLAVGGIRISHMSDIKAPVTMALTMTKGNKRPFTVQPLVEKTAPPPPQKSADDVFLDKLSEDFAATKSAAKWLDTLILGLGGCPSSAALFEICSFPSVKDAQAKAPPHIQAKILAAINAAEKRLTPRDEEPTQTGEDADSWPGPDPDGMRKAGEEAA